MEDCLGLFFPPSLFFFYAVPTSFLSPISIFISFIIYVLFYFIFDFDFLMFVFFCGKAALGKKKKKKREREG